MLTHSVDDAEAGLYSVVQCRGRNTTSNFLSTTFYRHYTPSTPIPQHSPRRPSTRLIVETPLPPPPSCEGQLFGGRCRAVRGSPGAGARYYEEHRKYYGETPSTLAKAYVRGRRWMRSGRRILH